MADSKCGPGKVNVIPLKTQQLALPQTGRDGKNVERLKPIALGCFEEPNDLIWS